jgi:pectinesterase inhibitor-like protein
MVQFEEDNPDDLLGNMVVLGISLIVIAAVVIGVVAGIDRPGDSSSDKMTQTEPLDYVCGQTDYKQSCTASLQPAGKSAAVISYFRVAVNATLTAMAHAMKMVKADADAVSLDHESEKMALEDCIELIGLCMVELQSVITIFINSTTSTSFHYDLGDIRSSLSAVLSYQRACLEGVLNKNFRNRPRFSLSSPNP